MGLRQSDRDERRLFTWRQKLSLLRAAGFKCEKCLASVTDESFHAHHRTNHANGGVTEIHNGMILCERCHKEVHGVSAS